MWKDLKIEKVSGIDKLVSEFEVWMIGILPYAKMKVRIFENQEGMLTGFTDVQLKRKFDGSFEGAVGRGDTEEEALEDTIKYFLEMVEQDYPDLGKLGLAEEDIEYTEPSDF